MLGNKEVSTPADFIMLVDGPTSGSGGNAGSVLYGLFFRVMTYRDSFKVMGSIVVLTSLLTVFIQIPCHAGMLSGHDNYAVIQARERFRRRKEAEHAHALQQRHQGGRTAGSLDSGDPEEEPRNQDESVADLENVAGDAVVLNVPPDLASRADAIEQAVP
jgi:hypothetical protein